MKTLDGLWDELRRLSEAAFERAVDASSGFLFVPMFLAALAVLLMAGLAFQYGGFVVRMVAIFFATPSIYMMLNAFYFVRDSANGQAFAMILALVLAVGMVIRTLGGASKGQKLFDGLLSFVLVAAILFFVSRWTSISIGTYADAVVQGALEFWEQTFGGARRTLE